ncbi:zinc-ribbon and DUF3426 domain-containing protein [Rhodoferax sp.]|uniref:zinc-ribbon and DUF3426 domain-containing protein n=1 Tax=Rhodoferax sp. TaxID=50421 RepID=UPI00261E3D83|nr:zinc-ribbon and DUF3426 domain-containing protein [Rhodoferax sp.]MDD3937514.1 zinc-ribbon and DUF3426 domain-containing protein [Rhodoferax sp.]
MDLIARCPACHTRYKLVPDQLRISDGWVRCGQCDVIFDASQQLVETEVRSTNPSFPVSVDDFVQTTQWMPDETEVVDRKLASSASASGNQHLASVPAEGAPVRHEGVRFSSEASWASGALLIKPSNETEADAAETTHLQREPLAEPVSFMQMPDRPSSMQPGNRRVFWWGLGVLLMFGLMVQGLYRQRDQMAVVFPELKPALQFVCDVMDCRVSSLLRIEDLVIDSATFQQMGQDSFELHFAVKNKGRFALALPAIELTLTDLSDQPVVRKVFTPTELGATVDSVAAAGEWSVAAYIRIRSEAAGVRPQGYRLLIFYP